MSKPIQIELLAPAKNLEFGKEAINHGADAVYIGAPKFGARANAGNSLTDIENLCKHAHLFNAKVYVTLNTLLFDNELEEAQQLIKNLYHTGIDALVIQDMGILELDLPPLTLHASTQCHNAGVEKVLFLEKAGFQRVVLARELNIAQIQEMKAHTNIELESFIHGSLCVCYSGQCYMSHAINQRSGNRGVCSQPCRSAYDLVNATGKLLLQNSHLLSLKDLNAALYLPEMAAAGVTSFKIEGRLKDIYYLKNITAYYRLLIDNFIAQNHQYTAASSGKTTFFFQPDPGKTFNRFYTSYFLNGRSEKIASLLTQKSIGMEIGVVEEVLSEKSFVIRTEQKLRNGDGLCFFNRNNELEGFLVNGVENDEVFTNKKISLSEDTVLFRNQDIEFERLLQQNSSKRKIQVWMQLNAWENGFELQITDEDKLSVSVQTESNKEMLTNKKDGSEQIIKQLSKLGETPFVAESITIGFQHAYFLPISLLNKLRREAVEALTEKRMTHFLPKEAVFEKNDFPYFEKELDYKANIINEKAASFYRRHGVQSFEYGVEKQNNHPANSLMTTKHCIKYQLEQCPVHFRQSPDFNQPLFLYNNKQVFPLEFDCKRCCMIVKAME